MTDPHTLLPDPWVSAAVVTGDRPDLLTGSDPGALADLVLDGAEPWWRRRACARGLTGRVPAGHADRLVALVTDPDGDPEIRTVLLEVLTAPGGDRRSELLDWMRGREGRPDRFDMARRLLVRRAALGDVTAAGPLAEAAAERWTGRPAQAALDVLAGAAGIDAVVAELGARTTAELMRDGATPARRMHGVRVGHAAGRDVTGAFADPSRDVARTAWELLVESADHDTSLWTLARSDGPARPWALAALHRRGHDVTALAQAEPTVPLPGVPPRVRTAIVRAFTPGGRRTDPRWLAEGAACGAALLESSNPEPEFSPLPELAACTLAAAGLSVAEPVGVGEHVGVGQGDYYVIEVDDGRVDVSTVGPFVRVTGTPPTVADALVDNGFLLIDENVAAVPVDGLPMQYGPGEIRTVGELLFGWEPEE